MRRITIILAVVIALGAVAVFFAVRTTHSTIKKELRDFAVADTASIDKIFMVEKSNNQVMLTRGENGWMVNGKYPVRENAKNVLLKTINRLRVKAPVSKAAFDNVIRMLATRNTKVEIYSKGKLLKTIYIGGPTQDQMGTFMMLEGSSTPFVVHIPGFVGYLSTRFFTKEADWRSTVLIKSHFNEIASIMILNAAKPEESFELEKDPSGKVDLFNLMSNQRLPQLDTVAINFYISSFEHLSCENYVDSLPAPLLDSLSNAVPMRTVVVKDYLGRETKIEAHRRYANGKLDDAGNEMLWDDQRMFARINNKDWVVIQYFVFNKIFKNFSDFAGPKKRE